MRHFPFISLAGTATAALLTSSEAASAHLQYDRVAILHGQIWRLFTCHFTHWSLSHFIWSAGAFLVLGLVCERLSFRTTIAVVASSAIAISLGIFFLLPALQFYRGLSGIDSALYGLLAVALLQQSTRQPMRVFLIVAGLIAFGGKVLYETKTGQPLFANNDGGMIPLPAAHAIGLTIGLGVGLFSWILNTMRIAAADRLRFRIAAVDHAA